MNKRIMLSAAVALVLLLSAGAVGASGNKDMRDRGERAPAWSTPKADIQGYFVTDSTNNVLRVSGPNRYATAAAISQVAGWAYDNTEVVFLASGTTFPDALAIGPSSHSDGPLLLTERDRLPAETRTELQRLRPCVVVALGGSAAISQSVLNEVNLYTEDCDYD